MLTMDLETMQCETLTFTNSSDDSALKRFILHCFSYRSVKSFSCDHFQQRAASFEIKFQNLKKERFLSSTKNKTKNTETDLTTRNIATETKTKLRCHENWSQICICKKKKKANADESDIGRQHACQHD